MMGQQGYEHLQGKPSLGFWSQASTGQNAPPSSGAQANSLLLCCQLSNARLPQVVNGALFIPAGVYRITRIIDMRKSVVLRGAGTNLTTIYIPVSLTDVYGNTWSEVRRSHCISFQFACSLLAWQWL
jgi:hypothetical protein